MDYGYDDLQRLMKTMSGDEKHDRAAHSTLDVCWVLYDKVLSVATDRLRDPLRDRFVLSKGHGPIAYYAVLVAKGFLDESVLETFGRFDSPLGHHPDRLLVPGVEVSSGSLGRGLPIAVGIAHALVARGLDEPRVVCLVGDGECDEGSVHEAVAYAGRAGLRRLTAVVVDNESSRWGWPGGVGLRFAREGWELAAVDGRDHAALEAALRDSPRDVPNVVVAEVAP